MAYKSTRMDQIKRIIEFHKQGIPKKRIARLLGISKNTVKQYIRRVELREIDVNGLDNPKSWYEVYRPENQNIHPRDKDLQDRLPGLIKELGRVGVTRYLLWEEYIAQYPNGFGYSTFCRRIKLFNTLKNATLKLEHKAAYHLMVDFTGKKMNWVDKSTGELHECEVLVCTCWNIVTC